jgi:hypothetical protein
MAADSGVLLGITVVRSLFAIRYFPPALEFSCFFDINNTLLSVPHPLAINYFQGFFFTVGMNGCNRPSRVAKVDHYN